MPWPRRGCGVRCCATRNSDADWNNYLAQLEALKVDRFVEILQIACDRMYR